MEKTKLMKAIEEKFYDEESSNAFVDISQKVTGCWDSLYKQLNKEQKQILFELDVLYLDFADVYVADALAYGFKMGLEGRNIMENKLGTNK